MGSSTRSTKKDVCDQFLEQLGRRGDISVSSIEAEELRKHFKSLPTRYALDVNTDGLDVLNHKRLLDFARADPGAVSFQVRTVDVTVQVTRSDNDTIAPSLSGSSSNFSEVKDLDHSRKDVVVSASRTKQCDVKQLFTVSVLLRNTFYSVTC